MKSIHLTGAAVLLSTALGTSVVSAQSLDQSLILNALGNAGQSGYLPATNWQAPAAIPATIPGFNPANSLAHANYGSTISFPGLGAPIIQNPPIAPAPVPTAAPHSIPGPISGPISAPIVSDFQPISFTPTRSTRLYGAITAGLNFLGASAVDGTYTAAAPSAIGAQAPVTGDTIKWDSSHKMGFGATAALGMKIGSNLRVELEGGIRQANIDSHSDLTVSGAVVDADNAVTLTPAGTAISAILENGRGSVSMRSAMVNGLFDLGGGSAYGSGFMSNLTPYIGGGIGLANVSVEHRPSDDANNLIDDSGNGLAFQLMAGANYALGGNMSLFGQYRMFGVRGVELEALELVAATPEAEVEFNHISHNIEAGLRFSF